MGLIEARDQAMVMVGDHHRDQEQIRIYSDVRSHSVGASRAALPCSGPWFYCDYGILGKRHPRTKIHEAEVHHHQYESECISATSYHSHPGASADQEDAGVMAEGHVLGLFRCPHVLSRAAG